MSGFKKTVNVDIDALTATINNEIITARPISRGGTGATTASVARDNLGIKSGGTTEIIKSSSAPDNAVGADGTLWITYIP